MGNKDPRLETSYFATEVPQDFTRDHLSEKNQIFHQSNPVISTINKASEIDVLSNVEKFVGQILRVEKPLTDINTITKWPIYKFYRHQKYHGAEDPKIPNPKIPVFRVRVLTRNLDGGAVLPAFIPPQGMPKNNKERLAHKIIGIYYRLMIGNVGLDHTNFHPGDLVYCGFQDRENWELGVVYGLVYPGAPALPDFEQEFLPGFFGGAMPELPGLANNLIDGNMNLTPSFQDSFSNSLQEAQNDTLQGLRVAQSPSSLPIFNTQFKHGITSLPGRLLLGSEKRRRQADIKYILLYENGGWLSNKEEGIKTWEQTMAEKGRSYNFSIDQRGFLRQHRDIFQKTFHCADYDDDSVSIALIHKNIAFVTSEAISSEKRRAMIARINSYALALAVPAFEMQSTTFYAKFIPNPPEQLRALFNLLNDELRDNLFKAFSRGMHFPVNQKKKTFLWGGTEHFKYNSYYGGQKPRDTGIIPHGTISDITFGSKFEGLFPAYYLHCRVNRSMSHVEAYAASLACLDIFAAEYNFGNKKDFFFEDLSKREHIKRGYRIIREFDKYLKRQSFQNSNFNHKFKNLMERLQRPFLKLKGK